MEQTVARRLSRLDKQSKNCRRIGMFWLPVAYLLQSSSIAGEVFD
jgi:hypothetical protein